MFEEVGHFVEKIRRTGYGPLVLDQEPGNLRELEPKSWNALRLAAEGKLRTPKVQGSCAAATCSMPASCRRFSPSPAAGPVKLHLSPRLPLPRPAQLQTAP